MSKETICCICRSEAIRYAAKYLQDCGFHVTYKAAPDVTHLLLPIPSFKNGTQYLAHLLSDLPDDVIIAGGNLSTPLLDHYRTVDFLQDPYYLADNAAITARCALRLVEEKTELSGAKVLVLGWGRIGKCLGKLLQFKGADVTIVARKDSDLGMINALGYNPLQIQSVEKNLQEYDVILNTVPAMILPEMIASSDCVILELASKPGMIGPNIVSALGLPGKFAPVESGKLIADTFIRLLM
ncbi:MAG: hypothetical protein IKJ99_08920 [Oscillospiraceae bacterium]|nr:hypothetical protein [Oscillospiraceae bacterium]